jgi:DHA1 family tetracycline resistance protein-like MFS transporter
MKTARLANIFIVVFIDMLGFGLVMPLLPYYAESFHATPLVIGLLVASFAAASLLGAPLLGRLSDRFGRRPLLLLSIAGTLVGYLFLGFAQPVGQWLANLFASQAADPFTISVLFFSRIFDGLTAGNITVAQAYISDVTVEKNRSAGMGVIGSAFGLGYIIGPSVGGMLSHWGFNVPALASAIFAFVNLISIFFFLPEPLPEAKRSAARRLYRPSFTLRSLAFALRRPNVGPLLLVRFFIMLAYAIFWSLFALFAQIKLNLTAQSSGFIMTYIGLYSVLVQGLGIRLLTKRFKDNTLIKTCLWLMLLGLVGWSLATNLPVLLLVILPLSGGGWTVNTIVTSAITRAVDPGDIGGILGFSNALESISRVIAPSIGGFMLGRVSAWAPGMVGAAVTIMAIGFAYHHFVGGQAPVQPQLAEAECAESQNSA